MRRNLGEPDAFIGTLREFQAADSGVRGRIANELADAVLSKRVDLAEVRQQLMDAGEADLLDTLDRLMDLIGPYMEEGGAEE